MDLNVTLSACVSDLEVKRMQFSLLQGVLWRNLILGNIFAPLCIALLLTPYVSAEDHYLWLLVCSFMLMVRYLCIRLIDRFRNQYPYRALFFMNLSVLVYSSLWPVCGLIYFDPQYSTEIVFLITFVVVCIMSGASVTLIIQPGTFYIYIVSMLTPSIYLLYTLGDPIHYRLSIALMIYGLGIAFLTRKYGFSVREQLELQLCNQQLMEKYRREKDSAINAEKEKARFLASASHDLRQPLHALTMFISLLQRRLTDTNTELIKNVNTALNDLTILFNALLQTSRLDSGDVEIKHETVDLPELIAGIMKEYKLKALDKDLKFRCHIRDAEVLTDKALLLAVLRNLLDNAIQFTHRGGVFLSLRRRQNHYLLQVWDSGIGIEKRYQKSVFKEFMQLNNAGRDRSRGVGLGLANSRKICNLLGYQLSLKSEYGRGTVLSLSIPLHDDTFIEEEQNLLKAQDELPDLEDIRVLLIESEELMMSESRLVLENMGATVLSARTPDEAYLLCREKPDVIISDFRLGAKQSGIELSAELYNRPGQYLPVIIFSGEIGTEVRDACDKYNWPMLSKPVDPVLLKRMILEVL